MGKTKQKAAALRMQRPPLSPEMWPATSHTSAKELARESREMAFRSQVGLTEMEIDFFTNATHTQNVTHKRSHA